MVIDYIILAVIAIIAALLIWQLRQQFALNHRFIRQQADIEHQRKTITEKLHFNEELIRKFADDLRTKLDGFKDQQFKDAQELRNSFEKRQFEVLKTLQESIQQNMVDVRNQITMTLTSHTENISKRLDKLTDDNNQRLKEISGQVEKRLTEGFEKTTATFVDVLKRLALIDEAQKKITELSTNVVSLQEILADKRSRGAFGEVQLSALIRNVLPESNFQFQHTLSNSKRVDCILFLPQPTGNVVIDSKFPLESFQLMTDHHLNETTRRTAEQQFRNDIKKHIQDIAEKYLIPGETADGAIMFIPAEAVFAEIHAHYPELVEEAYRRRVWMTSPTTMMAILTTARAVLKDEDTRKQVHVIQEHLSYLAKDFQRFQKRMDALARHIEQANEDVKDVHTSARKISSRFQRIEKVEIDERENAEIEHTEVE